MLHVIYNSGFPFITSGIDLAKLVCSGLERLTYSIIILVAQCLPGLWHSVVKLQPQDFTTIHMSKILTISIKNNNKFLWCIWFQLCLTVLYQWLNSRLYWCSCKHTRLGTYDLTHMPYSVVAFIALLTAGLASS